MTFEQALLQLQAADPLRVTVSGDIGSGKSTFAKHLAEALEIPRISVGQLMREEAARRNMTLDDFGALLETDEEVDKAMDTMQTAKSKEITRGVFEGRMAWHFVESPKVRVFLSCDPDEAAQRIWNDHNGMRDTYASIEELRAANETRKASEETRYQTYYSLSAYDLNNFDVVVNTTNLSKDEVFEETVIKIAQIRANS